LRRRAKHRPGGKIGHKPLLFLAAYHFFFIAVFTAVPAGVFM
jgi:hypothetical protein